MGYVCVIRRSDRPPEANGLATDLEIIAVRPPHQRDGVGSELARWVIEKALAQDCGVNFILANHSRWRMCARQLRPTRLNRFFTQLPPTQNYTGYGDFGGQRYYTMRLE